MPAKGIFSLFLSWINSYRDGGKQCPVLISMKSQDVGIVVKSWSFTAGEQWLLPAA